MTIYVARKLLSVVGVLVVVSMLVFFLGRAVVPGDVSQLLVGTERTSPGELEAVRARLGLDRPVYLAYVDWIRAALTGDLGTSPLTGRTVTAQLKQEVPLTLELALISLLVTAAIGVPLGVLAAARAGGRSDSVIRLTLLTGFAIPTFVIAVVLVYLSSTHVRGLYQAEYVPLSGDISGHLKSLILPVVAIVIPTTAVTVQLTRAAMLDVLAEPHITMARAKGARPRSIKYRHALKCASPTILTLMAMLLGGLVGGVIVVENVFNIPGLGRGIVEAINNRDFQLLVPQVIIIAAVFTLANVTVEILHPLIDPRVER